MAYRSDEEALANRRRALESELGGLRRELDRLEPARQREAEIRRELAHLARDEESARRRRALPLLDRVKVATPCREPWNRMEGSDRVRYCARCEKSVYNLSAMPREDAESLLGQADAGICVRFFRRPDGTIVSGDCPGGASRRRRNRVLAAAALAVLGASAGASATLASQDQPEETMGRIGYVEVQGGVGLDPEPLPVEHNAGPIRFR